MPPANALTAQSPCPCGSAKSLADCCQIYLEGKSKAPTAESLMRSRYTAYVLVAVDYLWETWSADQRIRSSKQDIQDWANSCEWLGLKILATDQGQPQDTEGVVSFVALYRQNGELHEHREVSVFKKTLGNWYYFNHK